MTETVRKSYLPLTRTVGYETTLPQNLLLFAEEPVDAQDVTITGKLPSTTLSFSVALTARGYGAKKAQVFARTDLICLQVTLFDADN